MMASGGHVMLCWCSVNFLHSHDSSSYHNMLTSLQCIWLTFWLLWTLKYALVEATPVPRKKWMLPISPFWTKVLALATTNRIRLQIRRRVIICKTWCHSQYWTGNEWAGTQIWQTLEQVLEMLPSWKLFWGRWVLRITNQMLFTRC